MFVVLACISFVLVSALISFYFENRNCLNLKFYLKSNEHAIYTKV
jgi:hypothetical protein